MAVIKNMMVRAGADFSAFTTQASKAAKSMRGMQSSISRSCAGIKTSVSGVKKVLSGLGVAVSVAAIVSAARSAAEAYDEQAENEMKLATVMRNTMKARNSEIQSVLDLCSAQQRLGIIGDEVQLSGAQELATYLTQTSTLKKLIPVMNDMVAQQYGFSASAENATNIATMLGKVMNGQVGALSRLGYSFTEAQEKILKYGTEEERAATLAKVINQSVGGMNRALASTPTGRMKQLSNTLGDIREKFGECVRLIGVLLLPLLWKVADVLERIANFANKAAVSLNKVFGSTSSLTGWQTVSTGVGEVTEDLDEAVTTAKELKRTLMGFDTLNILGGKDNEEDQTQTSSAGSDASGSEGSMLGGLSDDLDTAKEGLPWLEKILTTIKDHLNVAKDAAAGFGAALLTWALGKNLIGSGLIPNMKTLLGLCAAVAGGVVTARNAFDAWNNGVSLDNVKGMLAGTISMASGLGVAFGNVGAGIGLLIGSGAMLVTGMKEWITTGQLSTAAFWDLEGGILGLGAGIALLTGSWIPLVVAGIAGIGLAIYQYWDEISAWASEAYVAVTDWFGGIYAAVSEWWEGVAVPGIASAIDWWLQGWESVIEIQTAKSEMIKNIGSALVTWVKEAVTGTISNVVNNWKTLVQETTTRFTEMRTSITTNMNTIKSIITAAVKAGRSITVTEWQAMLQAGISIWSSLHSFISSTIQSCTNFLASVSWYSLGVNLMQGFLNGLRSLMSTIWNEVVDFVRRCTEAVRNALGEHSPSTVAEDITYNVDRGALKGLRSGMPEILAEATGMADSLIDAMTPDALSTSKAYEGLDRNFPTADGEVSFSGEESMNGVLGLLEMLYDAVVAGRDTSITIGEEEVFNAVVRANNRAINRTGLSPLRG